MKVLQPWDMNGTYLYPCHVVCGDVKVPDHSILALPQQRIFLLVFAQKETEGNFLIWEFPVAQTWFGIGARMLVLLIFLEVNNICFCIIQGQILSQVLPIPHV